MQIGLGISLTSQRFGNPFVTLMSSLLSGASQLIAHPLEYGSMFQDRAGTTPVTEPGQLVGHVLDFGGGDYHATAISDAARGVFAVVPETGRRNLLTRTEEFDNAAWGKFRTGSASIPVVTANAANSPIGDNTADRVQFASTGADLSVLVQELPAVLSAPVDGSVYLRSNDSNIYTLRWTLEGLNVTTIVVTPEWQRFERTHSIANRFQLSLLGSDHATADILIWGAQLEIGSTATAYQRVGSEFDVTEAGVPSLHYVAYNGVNTAYATPALPAPLVDKAQVFAGVRKLSDATIQVFYELSTNTNAFPGSFIGAPGYSGSGSVTGAFWNVSSKGTIGVAATTSPAFPAPDTAVQTHLCDISGDLVTLRIDGTQVAQSTADQGTGNFNPSGTYPLYYGARAGTSLFFNGRSYATLGPITRFSAANATAEQIAAAEAYYTARVI